MAAVFSIILSESSSATTPSAIAVGTCGNTNGAYMNEMSNFIEMVLTNPEASALRDSAGLAGIDPGSARIRIASDSLCDRAGRLMNYDAYLPDTTTRHVFLIRLGNRYWAEDSTLPKESRIPAYIMDSTLSTTLEVIARAKLPS
jgi:hypothetical protein